jgi:3-oxoacyl-[acyl-carrier protein] reductase
MTPRRALVTGGSKGIGLAIANALFTDGFDVTALSRTPPGGPSELRWVACDVSDPLQVEKALRHANYDVLVNNVGGGGRWGLPQFLDTALGVWADVHIKNAGSALAFTHGCVPHMFNSGWGRVVTIGSIYGKEAGGRPWFTVAKASEIAMMKSLSQDKLLVRAGITFNTVCPGHISVRGKPDEDDLDALPMGRMGRPEEVAAVVAFLCSEKAAFVNGACIVVDGGESRSY